MATLATAKTQTKCNCMQKFTKSQHYLPRHKNNLGGLNYIIFYEFCIDMIRCIKPDGKIK